MDALKLGAQILITGNAHFKYMKKKIRILRLRNVQHLYLEHFKHTCWYFELIFNNKSFKYVLSKGKKKKKDFYEQSVVGLHVLQTNGRYGSFISVFKVDLCIKVARNIHLYGFKRKKQIFKY